MEFYYYDDIKDLSNDNVFGNVYIKQPKPERKCIPTKKSVIVIPGILFDYKGNRLGYGGGYYDRFLEKLAKESVNISTIMAAYGMQRVESIPIEDTDIKPDKIITEE